ncbi:DNA topoisomerase III [Formosimonas limnophila]|uniref:DNA topoisomerase n=1 Tax=Formosimonas limnophila TaxID=1384487 RepID=A0A8J3FZA6_9BURK|nr:DNA topoisomerase III [Formosimonas limnophila]GHA72386.1 DNA topoisomerase III [Formosimonas limnophila]
MSKILIIAEKPSVANDIAKAIGGCTKKDDFHENDEYVVAAAVGHLLELVVPEEYDIKRGKWSFTHLPHIPPHFDLRPIAKSESKLKTLTKLLKRKDVSSIINACDAGREGELIFRYIMQYTKAKQPSTRLWLQSMTPTAIRDGLAHLRTDEQMLNLADAARSRSEADWLVGINGTRAMTAFNSKDGGFFLTTVGRVQTPTLTVVVEREEAIRAFKSRDYWEVHAEFVCAQGVYKGRWFDPKFKKDAKENAEDPERKDNRLWSKISADTVVIACEGQSGVVTEETKPATQMSPALFDLTSLQREANARFGFSAKNTLGLAQALYEKHKVLTYPRTDARALPEDYINTVKQTLTQLKEQNNYTRHVQPIEKNGWVKPNKRIFDNSKISDHFAIIPTLEKPKNLSEPEQKLYDLVVKRFLSVFYPPAEFLVTTRVTTVKGHHFKTEGRVLTNPSWLAIYGRDESKDDDTLVAVAEDEKVKTDHVDPVCLATRPPARYSEATLLSAMEGAGKLLDDELKEAMSGKGLGTPATRATIIEGLLGEKYIVREGRELIPTAKAFQLLTLLRGLGVEELTSPELTGHWETKLAQMERGELKRDAFMRDIAQMTQIIVKRAKEYNADTIPGDYATLKTPCPNCGSVMKENYRRFACAKCEFSISKTPGGRTFELPEVEDLLKTRETPLLTGFRSKRGLPFAAILRIVEDKESPARYKMEFDFGQSNDDDEEVDFTGQTPIGLCIKCGGKVYDNGVSYICENATGLTKNCDFRSGKVILQQEVSPEQMAKLLTTGRTDLLTSFKSARTGRMFKAYLVNNNGKTGFEFEAKAPKAEPATKSRKTAKTDVADDVPVKKTVAQKTVAKKPSTKK